MKFHRIESKLPVGVTLQIEALTVSSKGPFGSLFDFEQLVDRIARYSSNVPVAFTLDVPEDAAVATAGILRTMADELMLGSKR
jgi:hypothetical protein